MPQHVHLGAGALGLGFVVPLSGKAGFSVILANRGTASSNRARYESLREARSYQLVFPHQNPESVTISEFLFADDEADRLITYIADPRTLLVTTALTRAVLEEANLRLLARALTARVKANTPERLFVVSCENAVDSFGLARAVESYLPADISSVRLAEAVVFVPAIADRICSEPQLDLRSNTVQVEVEQFSHWILQRPFPGISGLESALTAGATKGLIEFVDEIAPYIKRKWWLINGPHMLIALLAFEQGYGALDRFVRETRTGARLLRKVLAEAVQAFAVVEQSFDREELETVATTVYERFRAHPERVVRVLHNFTGPTQLQDFVAAFHRKVADLQLRRFVQDRTVPFWTSYTILLTTRLVAENRYCKKA